MSIAVSLRRMPAKGWFYAVLALAALLIAVNWIGYDGADDRSYAVAAEAWLHHFPVVGTNHWATRHMVVLPVALSLALFGQKQFALAIPSILYFAGFLWLNFHVARRFLGDGTASDLEILQALHVVRLVPLRTRKRPKAPHPEL